MLRWFVVASGTLLVLAGCSEPPARERTDESALFEITSSRTARVTVVRNGPSLFDRIEPSDSSTATTTPPHPTPQQQAAATKQFLDELRDVSRPPHMTTGVRHPAATIAAAA